jgi:hypothetical protein
MIKRELKPVRHLKISLITSAKLLAELITRANAQSTSVATCGVTAVPLGFFS